MNQNTKIILALLALAASASAAALLIPKEGSRHPVAHITLDGELVQEIDLDRVGTAYSFQLTGASGLTNTILVEPGRIRVLESDCPDQICVRQGAIADGTVPIVCLPNRLVIEIVGGGEVFDAATG